MTARSIITDDIRRRCATPQNAAMWALQPPVERRAIREGWAEMGFPICAHDDCPPWQCERAQS